MQRHPSPRHPGFSILELAVVLVIISFVVGTSLIAGDMQIQASRISANQNTLIAARDALVLYQKKNKRYPCPAGSAITESTATYGSEIPACMTSCPAGLTCPTPTASSPTSQVVIGMVPFATLGLPREAAYDQQGSRLTYVVDRTHTLSSTTGTGNIQIVDAASNAVTASPYLGKAIFALILHGDNKSGAYQRNGTRNSCTASLLDTENCNDDNLFRDTAYNKGNDTTKYFDDMVLWKAQSTVKMHSSVTGMPAGVSSNAGSSNNYATVLTPTGHLFSAGYTIEGSLGITSAATQESASFSQLALGTAASFVDWTAIDGDRATCALRSTGALWCWGTNQFGQMGLGNTTTPMNLPTLASGFGTVSSFSVASDHICAITTGGGMSCSGQGTSGQLGNSGNTNSSTPVAPGASTPARPAGTWTAVGVSQLRSCAVYSDTKLYCWGVGGASAGSYYGNGGSNPVANQLVPVLAAGGVTGWTMVALSSSGAICGINAGRLYCWGIRSTAGGELPRDAPGGTGIALNGGTTAPVQVGSLTSWTYVNLIENGGCGIAAGSLYCWGQNNYGQVGDNTTTTRDTSVPIAATITDWVSVGGQRNAMCAMRSSTSSDPNAVYCWGGSNPNTPDFQNSRLGSATNLLVPTRINVN